jgi:hypothetical protein
MGHPAADNALFQPLWLVVVSCTFHRGDAGAA